MSITRMPLFLIIIRGARFSDRTDRQQYKVKLKIQRPDSYTVPTIAKTTLAIIRLGQLCAFSIATILIRLWVQVRTSYGVAE